MATAFQIERGVPLPHAQAYRKYPWAQMSVGDSFVVGQYTALSMRQVSNCAVNYGRRHGKKFACRKDDDGNLRVWRVA